MVHVSLVIIGTPYQPLYNIKAISPVAAAGPGRCMVNNGGCWSDTKERVHMPELASILISSSIFVPFNSCPKHMILLGTNGCY